jgi:uncharacterized protein
MRFPGIPTLNAGLLRNLRLKLTGLAAGMGQIYDYTKTSNSVAQLPEPIKPEIILILKSFKPIIRSAMQTNPRRTLAILSPIALVIIGHFAALIFTRLFGNWAWVGSSLVYWGCILAMIAFLGDQSPAAAAAQWFRRSTGSRWWALLAISMGLISFPLLFFPNLGVMRSAPLVAAWFVFAVINSILEESYWRGFVLDQTRHLPRAFGVIYSTVLFTSIHPLMLGVFSKIQAFNPANPLALLPFGIILVVLALMYCLLYFKTGSLRLAIFSHFLTDLGNLSIFLFMNMV